MKLNERVGLMSNKQNNHKEDSMKKSLAMLWLMTATVGLLVVGCNKNPNGPEDDGFPPSGVTDEISSMKYLAENDEFVKNDEQTFADQAIQPTDYSYVMGQIESSITPLRWGRFVANVTSTKTIVVQPGDSTAIGHVSKTITGTLKIKGLRGTDTVLVEKPFTDKSDRNIIFKRIDRNARKYWKNWIPVATSLVDGGTLNSQIDIKKVEFVNRNGELITITDPQTYYLRYRWLRHRNGDTDMFELSGGDSVRMTVTLESASADTDFVALRFGFNSQYKNRARMALVSQVRGGTLGYVKVYARTFYVHPRPGHFHAAIDAMTRATLYDETPSVYSVSWWGVPYRVF
jgi:hypothetical protein